MGCPDWPKCFGSFIPPTSVEELPDNYKEIYSDYRDKKNQRFAAFLEFIGSGNTANAILNDPQIKKEGDFDPVKTMIEYINRLIGALIGIMLTALFFYSFRQPLIFRVLIGLAWLSVLITGWFGSIVVSTNLTPWTVSIHLGLAFLIIGLLSASWSLTRNTSPNVSGVPIWLIIASAFGLTIQVILGTLVRSEIDRLSVSGIDRSLWIESLGNQYFIHRTLSWLVLVSFGAISWNLFKRRDNLFLSGAVVGVILALMVSGAILSYLGVPWMVQPVHLLLATIAFGLLVILGLKYSLPNLYKNAR